MKRAKSESEFAAHTISILAELPTSLADYVKNTGERCAERFTSIWAKRVVRGTRSHNAIMLLPPCVATSKTSMRRTSKSKRDLSIQSRYGMSLGLAHMCVKEMKLSSFYDTLS